MTSAPVWRSRQSVSAGSPAEHAAGPHGVPKLLFDENLAARLVRLVADTFPGSTHVEHLGLLGAPDQDVWTRAGDGGFILVTKDEDFHRMSVMHGPPPKVVWLRIGNCTTQEAAQILVACSDSIRAFATHDETAFFAIE